MRRILLLSSILAAAAIPALDTPALAQTPTGDGSFYALPAVADTATLLSIMSTNANLARSESGGTMAITLAPGDLTPGMGGSATDAQGNVFTLPWKGGAWGDSMGQPMENGQPITDGTGWVDAIRIVNGVACFENAKGLGWGCQGAGNWVAGPGPADPGTAASNSQAAPAVIGNNAAPTATTGSNAAPAVVAGMSAQTAAASPAATSTCTNAVPNYAASAGGFGVINGQIYSPNGQPVTFRGINVNDTDMASAMTNLLQQHPGTNFIRLAVFSYQPPAAYQQFIDWATKQGIVVEFENHQNSTGANIGGGTGSVFTNANGLLQPEQAWYGAMAAAYKGNPYVAFGTNNEPTLNDPAGLAAWQQTTYDTIRSAGNNNLVFIEEPGGGALGRMGAGVMPQLTGMTNIAFDMHYYPWATGPDANSAASTLTAMVQQAQTIQSADGKVPVMLAEVGQYDGVNNNTLATQAAMNSASGGQTAGVAFWEYNDSDPNNLSPGTAYGQQIAPWIAASGTQGCAQSPLAPLVTLQNPQPGPNVSPATPQPGPNVSAVTPQPGPIVTPDVGTATDARGNVYTIDNYGNVLENGVRIPGGGDTSQFVIVNGVIYGKDNGHGLISPGGWFTFGNGYWTPSAAPPLVAAAAVQMLPLTAQPETAPPLAPASTTQTAPVMSSSTLSVDQVAALAATGN